MSLHFAGAPGDYLTIPDNNTLAGLAAYTIMGWFRYTATIAQQFVYNEGWTGGATPLLNAPVVDNGGVAGQFRCAHRGDGGVVAGVTSLANVWGDGAWHRYIWRRNGAAEFELWLDGVSQGQALVDPGVTTTNRATYGVRAVIGTNPYTGDMQRMVNISASLRLEEAESILRGMHPSHDAFSVYLGLWRHGGPQEIDLSGNGRHATYTNVTTETGAPTGAPFAGDIEWMHSIADPQMSEALRRALQMPGDMPWVPWPPPDMPEFTWASLYGPWERKMELGVRGNWHSFLRK